MRNTMTKSYFDMLKDKYNVKTIMLIETEITIIVMRKMSIVTSFIVILNTSF